MTTRIAFLFLILLSFVACQPSVSNSESAQETDSPEPKDPAPKAVVTDEMIEAEREAQLAVRMAEEELDYFARERFGAGQFPPGEWREQDGVRTCVGFLTRNAIQTFVQPRYQQTGFLLSSTIRPTTFSRFQRPASEICEGAN